MTSSTTAAPLDEMSPTRWVFLTLGLIALLALTSIGVAWRMDVFGMFRDPRGRALITSEHERKAKYLLNQSYVPVNYDALIIGASASVNWRPDLLTGYRFYNESLEGGDASEERKLVEQALPKGHFKVALVGLYPRITALHVLQDGFDKAERAEVLGSLSAYGIEYDILRDKLTHTPSIFTPDGSHSLPDHAPPPFHGTWDRLNETQDAQAVSDYRTLVEELQARGTHVVYVVSPLFDDYFRLNQDVMDDYLASVRKTMPTAPLINFNAPEFTAFRQDQNNYIDTVHLSKKGALTLTRMVNEQMHKALKDE